MIALERISKRFGAVQAVHEISLEVAPGETLAVIGPSGCGKTTLLRLIAGFETPDAGRILLGGVPASDPSGVLPPHRRRLSMIFQDLALWPHMTVREHLEFALEGTDLARAERLSRRDETLDEVALGALGGRRPRELSGGERQRLAIGRAVVARPRCLLMDEPFSNLDPVLREELRGCLARLREAHGMTILHVTHQAEDVLAMADRAALLQGGRLVRTLPVPELRSAPELCRHALWPGRGEA